MSTYLMKAVKAVDLLSSFEWCNELLGPHPRRANACQQLKLLRLQHPDNANNFSSWHALALKGMS